MFAWRNNKCMVAVLILLIFGLLCMTGWKFFDEFRPLLPNHDVSASGVVSGVECKLKTYQKIGFKNDFYIKTPEHFIVVSRIGRHVGVPNGPGKYIFFLPFCYSRKEQNGSVDITSVKWDCMYLAAWKDREVVVSLNPDRLTKTTPKLESMTVKW